MGAKPDKWSITCAKVLAGYISASITKDASSLFSSGMINLVNPSFVAEISDGNTPVIERRVPSSDNSPKKTIPSVSAVS